MPHVYIYIYIHTYIYIYIYMYMYRVCCFYTCLRKCVLDLSCCSGLSLFACVSFRGSPPILTLPDARGESKRKTKIQKFGGVPPKMTRLQFAGPPSDPQRGAARRFFHHPPRRDVARRAPQAAGPVLRVQNLQGTRATQTGSPRKGEYPANKSFGGSMSICVTWLTLTCPSFWFVLSVQFE